ncbi:MAG: phosphoribosylformylglycinamidine cyclo-ligase [Clostridia bacterium]
MKKNDGGMSYKDAGVDVEKADNMVRKMEDILRRSWTDEVRGEFGGFAAAFAPRWKNYRDPQLIACTDGVGTKLRLLAETERFREAGRDCAAMVLNDLLAVGAHPLFFLDYIAADRLQESHVLGIVRGLTEACAEAGCALIGGETAEMPGYYHPGDYEVVGFAVGMVEGDPGERRRIRDGDVLIGIPSTGPHSNGFSLIRRILEKSPWSLDSNFAEIEGELGERLLTPTPIYAPVVLPLFESGLVKAAAHITGGGILGNLPRIMPKGLTASVDWSSWTRPGIFDLLARAGEVAEEEMRRTFNLGVGMILVVAPQDVDPVIEATHEGGYQGWIMGHVERIAEEG